MDKGRFQVIFDRLNKSVVHTETMTATIRVERLSEVQEIEDRIDPEKLRKSLRVTRLAA